MFYWWLVFQFLVDYEIEYRDQAFALDVALLQVSLYKETRSQIVWSRKNV